MSELTTISVANIIGKVFRDYKPTNNGWDIDAVEWIGDALGKMKINIGYALCKKVLQVKEYRVKIPCGIEQIMGIEFDDCKLNYHGTHKLYRDIDNELAEKPTHALAHYTLNPGAIHTSFEEGEITVWYKGIPTDERGYPLIINDDYVREALTTYIMMKYLQRGGTHPVVDFPFMKKEWEVLLGRARNSVKMPSVERAWDFMSHWISLIPNIERHKDFFTNEIHVKDDVTSVNSDINQFRSPNLTTDL